MNAKAHGQPGELWPAVAAEIGKHLSRDGFERWFSAAEVELDDGAEICLTVPNPIHQFFIESNYLGLLEEAFLRVLGEPRRVRVVARQSQDEELVAQPPSRNAAKEKAAAATAAGLNVRNTFEHFVVGPNNEFAYNSALAVAKSPGLVYSTLFIYGGSGLGKTHLLQAIGHYVLEHQRAARVVYLSSEQFTNEFIDAIRNGTLVKFRKRYRHADVLMIDDIQFLAGKERSQEEFFHTFNSLHDGHKQIVLSSDRPACEIEKLEERLVSRCEWGMTAELQPPDFETRVAILRKKAEAFQLHVEPWVIEYLAERIRNNVRRLEGALTRVASYQSLSSRQVTREVIENLLRDIFQEQARRAVTIDQIQRKVAEHFDVRLADMTSKRRPAHIAFPRQVAMYLARELTGASLTDIGEAFGGKDHGTVIHAVKQVKRRMEEDENTRAIIRLLDSELQR